MIRKASIIGTVALGMAIAAFQAPSVDRIASSARAVQRNFQNLKHSNSLSPIERFVFSFLLAKTEAPKLSAQPTPSEMPRT